MPQVVGAIIGAVASVAGVIGSVVGAVMSVVSAIVSPIVSVISTIVGGITGFLGPLVDKLLSPLTSIVDTIVGPLTGQINIIGGKILGPVADMQNAITGGMGTLTGQLTKRTSGMLTPIISSMMTVRTLVGGVNNIIVDALAPVTEVSQVVRSISTIKLSNILLAGTQDVLGVMGDIGGKRANRIAAPIAGLWNETVELVAGLSTIIDDQYKLLAHEIDTVDDRLKQEQETALAALTGRVDVAIASVTEGFSLRMDPVETQLALVTRRLEDVPEFQKMMIKSLS